MSWLVGDNIFVICEMITNHLLHYIHERCSITMMLFARNVQSKNMYRISVTKLWSYFWESFALFSIEMLKGCLNPTLICDRWDLEVSLLVLFGCSFLFSSKFWLRHSNDHYYNERLFLTFVQRTNWSQILTITKDSDE